MFVVSYSFSNGKCLHPRKCAAEARHGFAIDNYIKSIAVTFLFFISCTYFHFLLLANVSKAY